MTYEAKQQRSEDIFAQALELPTDKRAAFLNEVFAGNVELQADVERLLASQDVTEKPTKSLSSPRMVDERSATSTSDAFLGQRVGPYEVKRRLGSGGFGNVYLGFRRDDYQQKVAIKVLRSDIDVDDRVLARFELERQLLADLQHDHIARLLYGGTLADGRPYIVMEYVKLDRKPRRSPGFSFRPFRARTCQKTRVQSPWRKCSTGPKMRLSGNCPTNP
jgi:hypothetical protein